MPTWQAEGLVEDYEIYRRGEAAQVTATVKEVMGAPSRSFSQFAQDYSASVRGHIAGAACPRKKFLSLTQNLFQPPSSSTSITRCQPHCSSPTKHTGPSPTSCRPSTLLKTHSHRRPTAPRGGFLRVVVSKATAADSDEATNFSSAVIQH